MSQHGECYHGTKPLWSVSPPVAVRKMGRPKLRTVGAARPILMSSGQLRLGKLTPIEYGTIHNTTAQAA